MRPVFADPKTDFVFQRIFGTEEHKPALLGFLNAVLELEGDRLIDRVDFLPPEQRPKVSELKHSIVDVKCVDVRGTTYVVEMQVLNVEAFDKRVVYNVAKAYTNQLDVGEEYPALNDVIGVTVCDFELWPSQQRPGQQASGPRAHQVPMLSRWRMQEQKSGALGLDQLQLVFLELPKYAAGDAPSTPIERWAYFFREARALTTIPAVLDSPPLREALDAARTARFSTEEWDAYIAAGMALQSERGALSLAHREGLAEGLHQGLAQGLHQGLAQGLHQGLAQGLRRAIVDVCELLDIPLDPPRRQQLEALDVEQLELLRERLKRTRAW